MSSSSSFTDINLSEYTEKSVVVRGNTRFYKEDLKKLGGSYNSRLRDGPGWIFSKRLLKDIESFIKNGKRLVTNEEIEEGEKRTKEWEKKKETNIESKSTVSLVQLLNYIKKLESKIDSLICIVNNNSKNNNSKNDEEYDEEEEVIPRKRLLR